MTMQSPLLEVADLKVHFPIGRGSVVHAVDGVSFEVQRGTAFALVGESGSGKTTTAMACVRLAEPTSGQILLDGQDITALSGARLRESRRQMQVIFQDPYASLNPRERVASIVRRPLELMQIGTAAQRQARVDELFEMVGLRPEQQTLFPHQFSGGQRQRIGIARALATKPALIVCDEPVSALDVAIQAQILNLLAKFKRELALTYLFISHDLGVVQHLCDEVAVMYLGRIVERASRKALFTKPLHPYTRALLSAVPSARLTARPWGEPIKLQGEPPDPINLAAGCRFAGRCPFAVERCHVEEPQLLEAGAETMVACHRVAVHNGIAEFN